MNDASTVSHFSHAHEGVRLHVAEAGTGPQILFLHGFPEFHGSWARHMHFFAGHGFCALAPDLRGYGQSDKPATTADYRLDVLAGDVIALLETRGPATIVGHDWGGIISWRVAELRPDLVQGLVVLNAPHPATLPRAIRRDPRQLLRSWYVFFFQIPWLPEWILARGALRRALAATGRPDSFTAEELRSLEQAWACPGAHSGMLAYYRAAVRYGVPSTGIPITPRTLILWGERDRALGRKLAEESLTRARDVQLHYFPQATHWVQHEEFDAVCEAVLEFLS